MRNAEQIANLFAARQRAQAPDLARMREVRDVINGDIVLPLPELDESERPAVANLAQQGMQQLARRVASVEPMTRWPAVRPGIGVSDDRARDRRRVTAGWWHDNAMIPQRLGQRARFFLAYASAPVLIMPDRDNQIPRWRPKNPLDSYLGEDTWDNYLPRDAIFHTSHTYGGLLDLAVSHPDPQISEFMFSAIRKVSKPSGWDHESDVANFEARFDVLEYWDSDMSAIVLVGRQPPDDSNSPHYSGQAPAYAHHEFLMPPVENPVGRCPVVSPGTINLDRQLGHFDGIVGMYQTQAALMALNVVANRRHVFPREWLVSRPQEVPEIVTIPDPSRGIPGEIRGGDLQQQQLDPSFRTLETMDRLEYAQRMTASLPSEFGGFSQSDNVRTGRRGAQVMGASIDFTIAESQEILARSLYEENRIAIAVDKAYFDHPKTYFISTESYDGVVKYQPSELWETDRHVVFYPIAGTDIQNLPIEGGQRVAMGTLSRGGFMEIDPLIRDPEAEEQRIAVEGLQTAFFAKLQALANDPESPFGAGHFARFAKRLTQGEDLFDAWQAIEDELAAELQEAQEQGPAPGGALPGEAAEPPLGEQPGAPMGEPDVSMGRFSNLLSQLGATQTAQHYRG